MRTYNIRRIIMKTFTKFSLAAVAVLGLSSGAYAASDVSAETLTTVVGAVDVNIAADNDVNIDVNNNGLSVGGVEIYDVGHGITTMSVYDNTQGGTQINTNTYINTSGVYGDPNTGVIGLESGDAAGIGYFDATGDFHGLVVDDTVATLSGGTNSSVLTLADGDNGGTTLTVGGSNPLLDPLAINQTVFSATSDDLGYNSVVTVGSALYDSTTTVQGGGADLTLSSSQAVLSSDNDIVLNANNNGMSYGGVVINDVGNSETIMEIYSNAQGGTDLYSTLDMNGNQIHGVAAGTAGTDAVNLNQLNDIENDMSKGIAATTAIANIPQVEAGKKASVGLGYGHYNGENALAIGGSWHFGAQSDGIMKVSVGTGGSGETAVGAGASWSW
ncbi:MAG: YadA-like family protein [Bacteroidales bacterium]|nr:YadA-like family protein [Bacteroidales bacterium]